MSSAVPTLPSPPRVNVMVPSTVGALIAEESTIVPTSALPSFLECTMMHECRRVGLGTLHVVMQFATQGLLRLEQSLMQRRQQQQQQSARSSEAFFVLRAYRSIHAFLQKLSLHGCRQLRTRLLEPFGPELRFLIVYWLERRALLSPLSSATLSESLYGSKRVHVGVEEQQHAKQQTQQRRILHLQPMSKRHGIQLALLLALGPYLEERGDFIRMALERRFNNLPFVTATTKRKLTTLLQVTWPLMRMTSKATFWVYQWRYLLGWTVFFDPYSRALNLIVRRVTQEDQQQLEQQGQHQQQSTTSVARLNGEGNVDDKTQQGFANIALSSMKDMMQGNSGKSSLTQRFAAGVVSLLIALSFLARVQGEQQEMQQEAEEREERRQQQQESGHEFPGSSTSNNNTKSVPPPPLPPTPRTSNGRASDDYDNTDNQLTSAFHNLTPKVCPLCQEPRVNPTASTSGYVFCYKCILDFVQREGQCPVSGRECQASNLVRLFEPRM